MQDGFVSTFARLRSTSDRVVLLRDVPKNQEDPATCLTAGKVDLGTCMFTIDPSLEEDADASVAAAVATGTEFIDPTPWVCWDGRCPVVVGDTLTYRDRGHITATYAAGLAEALGRRLKIWSS